MHHDLHVAYRMDGDGLIINGWIEEWVGGRKGGLMLLLHICGCDRLLKEGEYGEDVSCEATASPSLWIPTALNGRCIVGSESSECIL